MSFCEQLRKRREELGMTRLELADRLGVSLSAVGNYETGISAPKEEVLLRLFDALEVDPNYLYRGSFRCGSEMPSGEELHLLEKYRRLPVTGRQTVHTLVDALGVMVEEEQRFRPRQERRTIPLYQSPAAAGFAAPVFGEDYTLIPVEGEVPPARSWPFAFRATLWPPALPTALWCTSTTIPCRTATWVSSAWTATCCASSTAGTASAWCICSP